MQLNDERAQREIYQKHESELKKDLERFQERSFQDEQNLVQRQTLIDILNKDLQEKVRSLVSSWKCYFDFRYFQNDLLKDFETK